MRAVAASIALFVGLSAGPHRAMAFGLTDHEAITRQAVAEFLVCAPGGFRPTETELLVDADADEDTNLLRKWLSYSHYFHPEKKLEMWRATSMERVTALQEEISSGRELLSRLGHLIHHLQDAASPPHVVPVNHWLTDGFETFEQGSLPEPAPADLDCQELARAGLESPRRMLTETARSTLAAARSRLPAWKDNVRSEIPWSWFWAEGPEASFGEYGTLGNRFGVESIELGRSRFAIARETYRELKLRQLRLAIQVTKKALAWARLRLAVSSTEKTHDQPESEAAHDPDHETFQ